MTPMLRLSQAILDSVKLIVSITHDCVRWKTSTAAHAYSLSTWEDQEFKVIL